jgi:Ca2+-transporting ATPase
MAPAVLPDRAVPLLPDQLLWHNLVTDGLPALALGVDRATGDPLDTPPRRTSDRLLSGRHGSRLAARAGTAAVGVMVVALWARQRGWSDEVIRTQLLLALLGAHLLLAYVVRSDRHSFEAGWSHNRVLLAAIGGSLLLQLPMFTTPVGRDLLGLAPLPAIGWAAAAVGAVTVIAVIDVARAVARRRSR